MAAQIISFFQQHAQPRTRDWSQQEIAEFYRVESALIQAGVPLESDRGLSDEGEPWFIFCRADNGEVFIHFALIDGMYVVDGAAFEKPARGPDFASLVRGLIARYPTAPIRQSQGSNIFVHPAALLIALVGSAFFQTHEAKAATLTEGKADPRRISLIVTSSNPAPMAASQHGPVDMDAGQMAAIILSAVLVLQSDTLRLPTRLPAEVSEASSFDVSITWDAVIPSVSNLTVSGRSHAIQGVSDILEQTVALPTTSPSIAVRKGEMTDSATILVGNAAKGLESIQILSETSQSPTPSVVPDIAQTFESNLGKHTFFLKISSAPPPAVEAMAVVNSSTLLAELVAKALPMVDKLPSNLLDLIGRGDHLNGSSPPPQPDTSPEVLDPAPSPGEITDSAPLDPVPELSPPPVPELSLPPVTGPVTGPIVDPAPTKPPPAIQIPIDTAPVKEATPPIPLGHDPAIDAAVAQFLARVDNLEILMQGKQLVIYDADILSPFGPALQLDSVTFTFADGSSLSLVGTVQDLAFSHWGI